MKNISDLKLIIHRDLPQSSDTDRDDIDKEDRNVRSLIHVVANQAEEDATVEIVVSPLNESLNVVWLASTVQFSFFKEMDDVSLINLRVYPVFTEVAVHKKEGVLVASLTLHKKFPKRKDFQDNLWDNVIPGILGQGKPEEGAA